MMLKRDCCFYHEEPDMGAHIPTCKCYAILGYCPCDKCEKYLSKFEADKAVRKYVALERELGDEP